MKKIIFLILTFLLLFSNLTFSQTKNPNNLYLLKTDLVKLDTSFILKDRKYKVYDGNNKIVPVDIDLFISNRSKINIDSLNQMIMESNISSMYKVKNKLTYSPIKFYIIKDEDGWSINETCQYKNDYGVLKELRLYYFFDNNFKMIKEKTFISKF